MADWRVLRRAADSQRDLLTRAQCLAAGLTDDTLRWRVDSGRWKRLHTGVYLTVPGRDDWRTSALAALLFVDVPGLECAAAFADTTAATWWGLTSRPPSVVTIVVPARRRVAAPPGVVLRRSTRWVGYLDELEEPARTTVAATVLDCAAQGDADAALRWVTSAVQGRRVNVGQLRAELGRRRGHPHRPLLRDVLGDVEEGAESPAEVRYIRDVERAHGLPAGERQGVTDAGRRRHHDNRYAAYRLVVEVDGRVGHERWADRVRDGQRDREVAIGGDVTLRVFWPDVTSGACRTAAEVGTILQARGWVGSPHPCRSRGCAVRRAAA
ncbi:type IV toxin-antitoxin system AbiEi family antitoxin domain-containing protein [Knoellia sp. LjRoot47]|uniref:type IV toxin-antitoxin system AbiEi family antitoxin domain-containing protein n=1 Tax=Knoellia sp. LjRoot47 TaxID=3342330 RepID=UPI003ED04496